MALDRTRIVAVLLLALAASCGGPTPPDGAAVWGTALENHADGSVHYDGRTPRESGEPWEESDVGAELTAAASAMETESDHER